MTEADAEVIRNESMAALAACGLQPAPWLPKANIRGRLVLRPAEEVARRLMGLHATVAWCCASEELVSSPHLTQYIDNNELFEMLTDPERDVVNTERSEAAFYRENVSRLTESMWALAWVLGFETAPGINGTPITSKVGPPLNRDFLEFFDITVPRLVGKHGLRPASEVTALEDQFFMAHNAFRALAIQHEDAYHPLAVVQERRHALTWSLSPGVLWEETDLNG